MKFTLKCSNEFNNSIDFEEQGTNDRVITYEFKTDYLPKILDEMCDFLKGCGFIIDANQHLDFISTDEEPLISKDTSLSAAEFLNGPRNLSDVTENAN
jgi:hypothetical protein